MGLWDQNTNHLPLNVDMLLRKVSGSFASTFGLASSPLCLVAPSPVLFVHLSHRLV